MVRGPRAVHAERGAAEFVAAYGTAREGRRACPTRCAEYQAASEFTAWQMLEAAAKGAGRIDDKAMAAWLKANKVQTVLGTRSFEGKFNSGAADTKLKQVQERQVGHRLASKFRPPAAGLLAH